MLATSPAMTERDCHFGVGVECTAIHFQPPSSTHTASATESTILGTPRAMTSMRKRQCTSAAPPGIDGRPWSAPDVLAVIQRIAGPESRLVRDNSVERFDVLPLLIATDGAIAAFGRDGRRLRPNLVIGEVEGLEERTWPGSTLRIGEVLIAVEDLRARCVMTTFDPDTLAHDPQVLLAGRQGAVDSASASKQSAMTRVTALLPAEKASGEAALAEVEGVMIGRIDDLLGRTPDAAQIVESLGHLGGALDEVAAERAAQRADKRAAGRASS